MPTTLLVVEDNEMNRDVLCRLLRLRGFAVRVAVDGQQALEEAWREPPAAILMDLGLPVLDGWSAIRQLRADARTARLPIVAVTAHAMRGDRERALEAGADAYEAKPVDAKRLERTLRDLIGGGA